jgi:mycoredoxin-dependent peroxiredoxin
VPSPAGAVAHLVVFFPQAFTPTCSRELRALDDARAVFAERGVRVVAVSVDSMATLRALVEQEGLAITVLSDFWPHGEVAERYGVFLPDQGWADRVSFLIDGSGAVRARAHGTDAQPRDEAVHLAMLGALRPGGR